MQFDRNLLQKYNLRGPRYTSYPPATEFKPFSAGKKGWEQLISRSNSEQPDNISLYFHIPFCPQLCHFCGCNSCVIPAEPEVDFYMEMLIREMDRVLSVIDVNRPVTQIHWGGGTPNSLPFHWIEKVMNLLSEKIKLSTHAEIAMECNPAWLKLDQISQLRRMGFNRLSLGIQDFDDEVLTAVNRKPSMLPLKEVLERIREEGFAGVNLDFIYGLPMQTQKQFENSILKAIDLRPDRMVTFSYAHVPWVKSTQKKMEALTFPSGEEKMRMLEAGVNLLTDAGYKTIGMDHFALPEDALGKACDSKTLHRNFQGYCTRDTTGQVYAFGASSISQLESSYTQNVRHWSDYARRMSDEGFACERGYELSRKERIIRTSITELMCNGKLKFGEMAERYTCQESEVKSILGYHPDRFSEMEEDGLVKASEDELTLTVQGMLLARVVAMKLDPFLDTGKTRFSSTM